LKIISAEINNPKPKPSVLSFLTCANLSNIEESFSLGIPYPSSLTETIIFF